MYTDINKYKQQAFTLLELTIAMAIAIGLLSMTIQVMISNAKSNRLAQQQMILLESANIAKYFLERDIRRAGFFAGLNHNNSIGGTEHVTAFEQACKKGDENYAMMLFPAIYARNNTKGNMSCLEDYLEQSDVLILRYLEPVSSISQKSSEAHKLYMRVAVNEGRLFKAKDEAHYRNKINNGKSGPAASFEARTFIYYLRKTGRRCEGRPIYGLFREYNNQKGYMYAEEIVSGLEQMQFEFLTGEGFKHADDIGIDLWPETFAVRVHLLLRSDCQERLLTLPKEYSLADKNIVTEAPPRYLRQKLVFDVALRNAVTLP